MYTTPSTLDDVSDLTPACDAAVINTPSFSDAPTNFFDNTDLMGNDDVAVKPHPLEYDQANVSFSKKCIDPEDVTRLCLSV